MMPAPKQRLGRGLAALIGESTAQDAANQDGVNFRLVSIDMLYSSPNNPRKHFSETDIEELSRSISEKGMLQPLVVRSRIAGGYEIVAGERRWRAAHQ